MSEHPVEQVSLFMTLGGQTIPDGVDKNISISEIAPFMNRVDDEIDETFRGIFPPGVEYPDYWVGDYDADSPVHDIPETLDGFIDTAYAALTGAIRLVGRNKAIQAWDAVVDANLAKVDGRHGEPIIDQNGKIQKPEGWTAPDIEGVVNG